MRLICVPHTALTAFMIQFGGHPIFTRLRGFSDNRVFNKTKEVADDLRERWETSDSRLVQRIQVLPLPLLLLLKACS